MVSEWEANGKERWVEMVTVCSKEEHGRKGKIWKALVSYRIKRGIADVEKIRYKAIKWAYAKLELFPLVRIV